MLYKLQTDNNAQGPRLHAPGLVGRIGVQEHVELLVRAGRDVGVDAVLRGADAPAAAQERKAVQVLEACARSQSSAVQVLEACTTSHNLAVQVLAACMTSPSSAVQVLEACARS